MKKKILVNFQKILKNFKITVLFGILEIVEEFGREKSNEYFIYFNIFQFNIINARFDKLIINFDNNILKVFFLEDS